MGDANPVGGVGSNFRTRETPYERNIRKFTHRLKEACRQEGVSITDEKLKELVRKFVEKNRNTFAKMKPGDINTAAAREATKHTWTLFKPLNSPLEKRAPVDASNVLEKIAKDNPDLGGRTKAADLGLKIQRGMRQVKERFDPIYEEGKRFLGETGSKIGKTIEEVVPALKGAGRLSKVIPGIGTAVTAIGTGATVAKILTAGPAEAKEIIDQAIRENNPLVGEARMVTAEEEAHMLEELHERQQHPRPKHTK